MRQLGQLDLREKDGGVVIAVKAVPGASRDRVAGVLGRALKVTTSAPPEKGKANAAVARTLARALGVPRRDVALVSGAGRAQKQFRIAGLSARQVRQVLGS